MSSDLEESPSSSRRSPASGPVSEAEPISLHDLEMILAPGVSPPPLPRNRKVEPPKAPAAPEAAAKDKEGEGESNGEGLAASDEAAPAKWTADAPPLRRRREKPVAATAPDTAFSALRPAAPAGAADKGRALVKSKHEAAREASAPGPRDSSAADLQAMADLCPPTAQAADKGKPAAGNGKAHAKEADAAPASSPGEDAVDEGPTSGLVDVRSMISFLQDPAENKKPSVGIFDDVLNLSGGILDVDATAPVLGAPEPFDEGPRADDDVLRLDLTEAPNSLAAPNLADLRRRDDDGDDDAVSDDQLPTVPFKPVDDSAPTTPFKPKTKSRSKTKSKSGKAKAAVSVPPPAAPQPASSSGRMGWVVAGVAVLAAAWFALRSGPEAPPPTTAESAQTARVGAPPTATVLAPVETVAPPPTASAAPIEAIDPMKPTAREPVEAPEPKPTPAPAEAKPKPTAATTTTPPPATAKPVPTQAPAPTATTPPPAPAGGAAFDRGAASAALGSAASQAAGCKAAGDPSGVARVSVTFAPSGRVTSALVSGPPFAGTQTGGCIATKFRSASVPPFDGAPVTVSKSINIR